MLCVFNLWAVKLECNSLTPGVPCSRSKVTSPLLFLHGTATTSGFNLSSLGRSGSGSGFPTSPLGPELTSCSVPAVCGLSGSAPREAFLGRVPSRVGSPAGRCGPRVGCRVVEGAEPAQEAVRGCWAEDYNFGARSEGERTGLGARSGDPGGQTGARTEQTW